jgi:phosphate transport system substrate-binding protein
MGKGIKANVKNITIMVYDKTNISICVERCVVKKILLSVVFLILAAVGCGPAVVDTPPQIDLPANTLALIAGDYPRVDGSTSAFPLQMLIACEVLGIKCIWWDYSPLNPFDTNTRGIYPEDENLMLNSDIGEKLFNIVHNGTHEAYMNLIQGDADIILVARQPSEDEVRAMQLRGVTLHITPVALDAFVFLVNVENEVEELSLDTIRDIYSGQYTLWSEVGGGEGEIQPYQRNPNSGSQELMEKLVMQGTAMVDAPDMILLGMMGPFNAISSDVFGIGYSVYFYAEYMFTSETVKMIGVNGVAPNSENIRERKYPLTTEVYVAIRDDTPEHSTARLLRDWLLTEAGQDVVEESGYVPVR